jgi:hypothetical protein
LLCSASLWVRHRLLTHKESSWVLELAQPMDTLVRLPCAGMATMIITHTLARLTVTTARIGSWTESSSGLALGSMDIMVVDSMAGATTAVVTTVGDITVVVVMAITAADLCTKASAVTAASMVAVVDFMEAAGFTAAVADSTEEAVSMVVEEATGAGIANCQES